MAWSKEQKRIFDFWAGKVPASVLAGFVDKSEFALTQYASRKKVSISFWGHGCQRNAKKRKSREFYQQKKVEVLKLLDEKPIYWLEHGKELTNREIAEMTGVTQAYVASIKKRHHKREVDPYSYMVRKQLSHQQLINTVFS
ncbi:hypothetical protein [Vibrio tarriae]|uniref:hypothetical protein n=1 Tax=Vibrio tarriae TaxID=2014742 RepID=UPI000DE4FB7E|nr:hypothetical protein [Vibrio tarriae]RBM30522.1 hypothetical protein DLR58_16820 [Vibrio tarriae]